MSVTDENVEDLENMNIREEDGEETTNGETAENAENAAGDGDNGVEEGAGEGDNGVEEVEEGEEDSGDQPVTLYIKAGVDNKLADCPLCQRLFMIIILKKIKYQVCTVNKDILPAEYKRILGNTPPPVLVDPNVQTDNPMGKVIDDIIKGEHYLESVFQPKLENGNPRAKQVGANIFSKFSALMKNQDKTKRETLVNRLRTELKKLDDFLKDTSEDDDLSPGKYLEGDNFTLADCDLLPKLHRVDVACRLFKYPEVMEGMDAVQLYLENWRSTPIYHIIKYEDKEVHNTYRRFVMKS